MGNLALGKASGGRAISPAAVTAAVRTACAAVPLSMVRRWACLSDLAVGEYYTDARQRVDLALSADLVPVSLPHFVDALHLATRVPGDLVVGGHLTLHGDVAPLQVFQFRRKDTSIYVSGRDHSGAMLTIAVPLCRTDPFSSVDWVDLDSLLPS